MPPKPTLPDVFKTLTWQEAEELLGVRVDRRLSYAWAYAMGHNRWQVCQKFTYSRPCTGCHEVPEMTDYPEDAKGLGCHECGYTGRSRRVDYLPYDGQEAERRFWANL